jgi:hypothetical protein
MGDDMDGAVWGAVGALGGAGLTALASYLVPLRTLRSSERQQADDRRRQRETGAIERLIAIRTAYRDWHRYLEETALNFRATGDTVQTVTDRLNTLSDAAQRAGTAAMQDGWWIGSEPMAFYEASWKVKLLVRGEIIDIPDEELERVRAGRNGLNEQVLERLEELLGDVPVKRYTHD